MKYTQSEMDNFKKWYRDAMRQIQEAGKPLCECGCRLIRHFQWDYEEYHYGHKSCGRIWYLCSWCEKHCWVIDNQGKAHLV